MSRRILLVAIALLYLLSVPWYRAADASPQLLFGLPDWVAIALGCYVGCAVLNAAAWLLTDVPDEPSGEDERFAAPAGPASPAVTGAAGVAKPAAAPAAERT